MIDWDGLRDTFSNFFASEGFKSAASAAAPIAAGAATTAIGNSLFPGKGAGFKGLDARTGTGQAAETARLRGAKGVGKQYQAALRGELDPREEYLIGKRQRAASAASGGLETGAHGTREMNAKLDAVNANRKELAAQLGTLSSGYTPLSVQKTEASPSVLGQLFSGLSPAVAAGTKSYLDPKKKKTGEEEEGPIGNTSGASLSDRLRGAY